MSPFSFGVVLNCLYPCLSLSLIVVLFWLLLLFSFTPIAAVLIESFQYSHKAYTESP